MADGNIPDVPADALVKRRRASTQNIKRLSKASLDAGRAAYPDVGQHAARPRTRAECPPDSLRCPWVSCQHHLYLDVNPRTGSIKVNFPDKEVWELDETCALRIADRGDGATLEEIADAMNLTRERARQLETRALAALTLDGDLRSYAGRDDDAPRYAPPSRVQEDDGAPPWETLRRVLGVAGWHEGTDRIWRSGTGRRMSSHDARAVALRLWRST